MAAPATTREARQIASSLAAIAFVAWYAASEVLPVPTVWYHPLEHAWSVAKGAGLAMGWYGHALGAGVTAAALWGGAVLALRDRRPSRRAAAAALCVAIASFLVAIAALLARSA